MATTASRGAARTLAVFACVASVVVVAACGATDNAKVSGAQVYGDYLNVYSSLSLSGPQGERGNAILNGERLAFSQRGGKIGTFILNLVSLNAVSGNAAEPDNGQVALNARKAVTDPRSIAYIGDLEPSQTRLSKVIVGQAQLLQVAPSSGWESIPGGRRPAPGFRASYREAFGEAPNVDALYGYEAMNAVLDAIERSGTDAGSRIAVADAYRAGPGN